MDLRAVRADFDIPDDRAYLNSAFLGPMPKAAVAAGEAALAAKSHPWTISTGSFFEPVDELRTVLAAILGGDDDGVAIIPAVSYGVAVAAANLPVAPGSVIVVMAEQFPSNVYEWQAVAERVGAELRTVVPGPDGWTPALLAAIDERTSVVAIEPCHWSDGRTVDVVAVGAAARAVGAGFVVDVSQTLGAVPFPLAGARPDFVTGVLYKWMLGAYGTAFLWAAPEKREGRPIEHNWLPRHGSRDFSQLAHYTEAFLPGARRFDVGQAASHINIASTLAAVQTVRAWDADAVVAHARALTSDLVTRAGELGLTVPAEDQRSPHIVGLHLPPGAPAPSTLSAALADANVNVSIRGTAVRVSAHAFNTANDIDRLVDVLAHTVR
jgi:selenocysteine lyase/cysteine desulfurase